MLRPPTIVPILSAPARVWAWAGSHADSLLLSPRLPTWAAVRLYLALGLVLGVTLVRNVWSPLLGHDDMNQWLYQGYFFWRNLHWTPLPLLNLVNDDVFFPYGVSNVFRPWNFESAYFYAALYQLLGHGPWLQWHFLLSMFLGALFSYLVVRREYGHRVGLFAGVALSFGNYYALGRYPQHFGYSLVHWMTLSILLDFLLVRRVVLRQPVTLRLTLAKTAAISLCLGHDLAYVCGLALTSTVVTLLWIVALTFTRWRPAGNRLWQSLVQWRAKWWHEWTNQKRQILAFLTIITIVIAFYMPLAMQVFLQAKANGSETMPGTGIFFPLDPARIAQPILPAWLSHDECRKVWGGTGIFTYRPGIFFVLGAIGAIALEGFRRRTVLVIAPFALMTFFYLTFQWEYGQQLRILPWLEQARCPGHFTLALPAFFLVAMLQAIGGLKQRVLSKRFLGFVLLFFLAESATAYYCVGKYARGPKYFVKQDFYDFMGTVARQPGAAVMEWPFTVVSGNQVGDRQLGVYGWLQIHTTALQAFHHKKVMSSYFGRIHPRQITPFFEAGWPYLNLPDSGIVSTHQHRDFTRREWEFLEKFYRLNDFCGIIVYADLLSPETVCGFHRRFGKPIAETTMEKSGRLQFIPKPVAWRSEVDETAGRQVAFRPPLLRASVDDRIVFNKAERAGFLRSGWARPDEVGRWTEGYRAELMFSLAGPSSCPLRLDLECGAFAGQGCSIFVNDTLVRNIPWMAEEIGHLSVEVPPGLLQDTNIIRFETPNFKSPLQLQRGQDASWRGLHVKSLAVLPAERRESAAGTAAQDNDTRVPGSVRR